MGQRVSKREQREVERMYLERNGLLGMVQCDGCPAGVLVHESVGLCEVHRRGYAHVAEESAYFEAGYDVVGNL